MKDKNRKRWGAHDTANKNNTKRDVPNHSIWAIRLLTCVKKPADKELQSRNLRFQTNLGKCCRRLLERWSLNVTCPCSRGRK